LHHQERKQDYVQRFRRTINQPGVLVLGQSSAETWAGVIGTVEPVPA
jgi:hypothetical protein